MISRAELALSLCICRTILFAIFIANCAPVYALNPDYPLSKYIHTSWGSDYELGSLRQLVQTPDGYLWIATSSGLVRFDGVRFTRYARADGQSLDNSDYLMVDPDGSLWVATYGGVLAHLQSGKFHAYSSRDGLPSDYIQSLYRDSQGVLWVGTRGNGIFRMAHGRFEKLSLGIPPDSHINGFLEDSDHALWIVTAGYGVFRLQNGRIRGFSVEDGLPSAAVNSIYRDHSGKIWTAGVNGISAWNGTRFVGQPAVNSVVRYATQCTEDRDGNLWIGASSGLFRVRAGELTKMDASSGLSADFVLGVYEDKEGNIWAATAGGLDRLRDAQVRTFTRRDGLFSESAAFLWPVVADRGAGVWIASGRQVVRIAGSKITAWPMALPSGSEAHTMLFEPDSSLLVGFGRGLKHWSPAPATSTPELEDLDVRCLLQARDGSVWAGTANRGLLHWKSYPRPQTRLDAVIPDRYISTLTEDRDGTIWAGSHGGGLYRIAGQQVQHFGQGEIRYTALTLSTSDTIQFRYRLEGFDDNWVDADTRRIALYNNLKPGTYTFRVQASAGEERWLESSPLSLAQIPFFYQTNWFLFLVAATAVSLIFIMYRLRLRLAVDRINAGSKQRMDERMRIARELHDTLLQSFQGAVFQFQAARRLLLRNADNAMQVVDEAIQAAEQGITEGRAAIHDLRPEPAAQRDLQELLKATRHELADTHQWNGNAPAFSVIVEGKQRDLSLMLQDEVHRICREVILVKRNGNCFTTVTPPFRGANGRS